MCAEKLDDPSYRPEVDIPLPSIVGGIFPEEVKNLREGAGEGLQRGEKRIRDIEEQLQSMSQKSPEVYPQGHTAALGG
jgi:hypothetical protein